MTPFARFWLFLLAILTSGIEDDPMSGKFIIKKRVAQVVCVGDSLTYGPQTADPGGTTSYPYYLAQYLNQTYEIQVFNRGVSGLGAADLYDVDYLLSATRPNQLPILIGHNNIFLRTNTPAEVVALIQSYVDARSANGWVPTVLTVPASAGDPDPDIRAAQFADLAELNDLIRATFPRVVDLDADPFIGQSGGADTTGPYFSGDHVHLSALGNQRIASLVGAYLVTGGHDGGPSAAILPQYGLRPVPSLTGYWRDWNTLNPIKATIYNLHNLAKTRAFSSSFDQNVPDDPFPHEPIYRVHNGLDGHPVMRFPGPAIDALGRFQSGFNEGTVYRPPLSTYVTSTEFQANALIKPTDVVGNDSVKYHNAGVICDDLSQWGLFLRRTAAGLYVPIAYSNPGDFTTGIEWDTPIPVNEWRYISFRIKSGKIGIRVGSQSDWQETPCGANTDLSGHLRIGANPASPGVSGNTNFIGDAAMYSIHNTADDSEDAADGLAVRSRYPSNDL